MNIIFLDIDGVLNKGKDNCSQNRYRYDDKWSHPTDKFDLYYIDPDLAKMLSQFIEENDLKIVISSTWRYDKTLTQLKELFGNRFLPAERIIGVTPELGGYRRDEIRYFLFNVEFPIDKFIIIDDDPNANVKDKRGKFIQTSFYKGLTYKHIQQMKAFLNK